MVLFPGFPFSKFCCVLMWPAKGRMLKSEHEVLMAAGLHCKFACTAKEMARELESGQGGPFVSLCRGHAAKSWDFCPLESELHAQPGAPRAGDTWGQLSRARTGLVSLGMLWMLKPSLFSWLQFLIPHPKGARETGWGCLVVVV